MIDEAKIYTMSAQRLQIAKAVHLSNFEAISENAELAVSVAIDRTVIGLKSWCLAEIHEAKRAEVKHFASWWDHFKADYFPGPLLARFPAATWTQTVFEPLTIRVCPHVHIPSDKNNRMTHIAYLNPNSPWKPE